MNQRTGNDKASSEPTVVVLTALDVERAAVRSVLGAVHTIPPPKHTWFEEAELPGVEGRIVLGSTGKGNQAAAAIAERAITEFDPVAVLIVGVAGALEDEVDLGDVVVASTIYTVESAKAEPDGLHPRLRTWQAPYELDQLVGQINQVGGWTRRLPSSRAIAPPRVHFEPIVAWDIVVNSSEMRMRLGMACSDAIAVEMESAGVHAASHRNQRLPVLTIRGISDRADGSKNATDGQGWQRVAATNAAAFAIALAEAILKRPPASFGDRPPRDSSGAVLDDVLRKLAQKTRHRLIDEVGVQGLRHPQPLRVRWTAEHELAADPATVLRDETLRRHRTQLRSRSDVHGVAAAFGQLPRRQLVLLGEPGSGKSATAMLLALGLLEDLRPGEPVPVLLTLSSWNPRTEHLYHWLARRLAEEYPSLGRTTVRRLASTGHLVPILDGLDEVPEVLRPAAIDEIDRAVADRPLVVTCRGAEYAAAVTARGRVFSTAAVFRLLPVELDDAERFLTATPPAGLRWRPVLAHLREHSGEPLAGVLASPLMVSLAREVYLAPTSSPAELLDRSSFPDRQTVEHRLLDGYVPVVYAQHPPHPDYERTKDFNCSPEQARRWLAFLAAHLDRSGQLDLAWWQVSHALSPAGLAGTAGAINALIIAVAVGVPLGAVTAPANGVVVGLTFGIAAGLATGIAVRTPVRPAADRPRIPRLRLERPVVRAAIGIGLPVGILAGVTFAIRLYRSGFLPVLLTGLAMLVLAMVLFLLVFGMGAPYDEKKPVDPVQLLRADRNTRLVFGLVLAALIAVVSGYFHAQTLGAVDGWTLGIGGGIATAVGCAVNGIYGRYSCGRLWLASRGKVPLRLMAFLADAHCRGVLRQSGAVYQFRHSKLQHRLATGASGWTATDSP